MIFYWLSLVTSYILLGYIVYLLDKYSKNPLLGKGYGWALSHKKVVLGGILAITLLVTMLLIKPLFNTAKCVYYGYSYGTETQYNWVLGDCLYKGRTGAWLPLKITRDVPTGTDDTGVSDLTH